VQKKIFLSYIYYLLILGYDF